MLTMASLGYILVSMLIELPYYFEANYSPEKLKYATFDWNILTAAAVTFFSFSCHVEILPVYDEMQ
jgi:amino acid permease